MKTRPSILLLGIVATAVLSVAAGAELKHTAPAKVDLTGLWKINPDLSDDPYEAVEKKRRDSAGGSRTGGGPMGGSGGRRGGGIVIDAGDILDGVFGEPVGGTASGTVGGRRGGGGGTSDRPAGDPEPSSMRIPLDSFLATLEQFEATQAPDSLTIATEEETTTCKPAAPGQAPLPGGESGDRRCGWQGDTWVTEIKAPNGVTRTNRYELKKGGRQLVMTSEINGGKSQLSGLRIKRVYDRVL
jgi:hypothetical protein